MKTRIMGRNEQKQRKWGREQKMNWDSAMWVKVKHHDMIMRENQKRPTRQEKGKWNYTAFCDIIASVVFLHSIITLTFSFCKCSLSNVSSHSLTRNLELLWTCWLYSRLGESTNIYYTYAYLQGTSVRVYSLYKMHMHKGEKIVNANGVCWESLLFTLVGNLHIISWMGFRYMFIKGIYEITRTESCHYKMKYKVKPSNRRWEVDKVW